MAVDFVVRNAPGYRVATRSLTGPWPGDRAIRREFESVNGWAQKAGLRPGHWFFREFGGMSSRRRRWEMGVELRSGKPARVAKGLSIKKFPATKVVAVKFDPDEVSPTLVYFGVEGWMRWNQRGKKFRPNGPWREVYSGNPWKSKKAWASTEVQAPIKK